MLRKIVVVSILLFVSWAWVGLFPQEIIAAEESKDVPKITKVFAVKTIKPGSKWKIYLNGTFPAGKVHRILADVSQTGMQNSYDLGIIRVKEESLKKNGKEQEFSGFLTLNIPGHNMNRQTLELELYLQSSPKRWISSDVTFSQPVKLALAIDDACAYNYSCEDPTPPAGEFQVNNYLGPIMVHLAPAGDENGAGLEMD